MVHELLTVGSLFDGRYEIRAVAGQGGMATVYRAYHRSLAREVALKVLHPNRSIDTDQLKRFKMEAQLVSSLIHPNITSVRSFGTTSDGMPYVAFELLEGIALTEIIESQEMPTVARFYKLFLDVCDGLGFAHEHHVVHRDLKPGNIFVINANTLSESAKILDFGIAKALPEGAAAPQNLTATGEVLGTPLYMSPEQCRGEKADQRSDIYSVGCVMYHWLTGGPPFTGASAYEVLYSHDRVDAPQVVLPAGYPAAIAQIVNRCLKKSPEERYQNVGQLKADLLRVRSGQDLTGELQRAIDPATARRRKRTKKFVLIGAASLVAVVGVLIAVPLIKKPVAHFFTEYYLRTEWQQGNMKPLLAEMEKAYNSADLLWARHLSEQARPSLSLYPSVDGALMYVNGLWSDPAQRARKVYRAQAWHILNSLPDAAWKQPETVAALKSLHRALHPQESPETHNGHRLLNSNLVDWLSVISLADRPNAAHSLTTEAVYVGKALPSLDDWAWNRMFECQRELWLNGHWDLAEKIGNYLCVHPSRALDPDLRKISLLQLESEILNSKKDYPAAREKLQTAQMLIQEHWLFSQAAAVNFELGYNYFRTEEKTKAAQYFLDAVQEAVASKDPEMAVEYYALVADAEFSVLGAESLAKRLATRILEERIPANANGNIRLAVSSANLLLGKTNQADAAWTAAANSHAEFEMTPYGRWAKVTSLKIPVIREFARMEREGRSADKVTAEQNLALVRISRAALAAAAGDYQKTASYLRDAGEYLADIDHDCADSLLLASAEAARIVTWRPYADMLYQRVLDDPKSDVESKIVAATNLSQRARLKGELPKAQKYIKTALQLSGGKPRYDVIGEASMVYGELGHWDKVYELGQGVDASMRDRADFQWFYNWGERYAMALRHNGHHEEAEIMLERMDRKVREGGSAKLVRTRV